MGKTNYDTHEGLQKLVGRQVDAYHDGKASPSRLKRVVIDNVIHRADFSPRARKLWRDVLRKDFRDVFGSCVYYSLDGDRVTKQFWDWNCDEFLVGHILYDVATIREPMLFARRPEGWGWYCVNWNYYLDLEGRVRRQNARMWRTCADEQGLRMEWDRDAGKYEYYDKKTGMRVEK